MTVQPDVPDQFDMPAGRLAARRGHLLRELSRLAPSSRVSVRNRLPSKGQFPARRSAVGLAVAMAVAAAVAAGAATGILPVGSQVPAERVTGEGEPHYTSDRTVVATGVTSNGLDWRMTVAESSNQGTCLGLTLLDTVVGDDGMDACGRSATFDALGLGGGDVLPGRRIVFGPVPENATAVRITAPGGFARDVTNLHAGLDDVPGDFYLTEIPRELHDVVVRWIADDGSPKGSGAVVESTITYKPQPPPDSPH